MRFGEAIKKALEGKKIARHGWNGKEMYVYLTEGRGIPTDKWLSRMPSQKLTEAEKKRGYVILKPHLDMMNAQGERIIGWMASQMDMLAIDWYVVDGEEARKTSIDLAKEKVKAEGLRSLKDGIELEGADMNSTYPKVVN